MHMRVWTITVGLMVNYENTHKNSSVLSYLKPHTPHLISSLYSPFARSSSHASHLFSLLCPLRGKSLCSVIRLIFFLFFFFLSSSSSTRTDLVLFYFCLIWYEKYVLKVEIWSTKHQATLICYQKPPGTNTDLNFFFFFIECGKFFFRSCMLCSC